MNQRKEKNTTRTLEEKEIIVKFPEDIMFQLTTFEHNKILISQNVTSNWGGVRKLPYAFTEHGNVF